MSKILDYIKSVDTTEVMQKAKDQFKKTAEQLSGIIDGVKNNNITNRLMDTLKSGFMRDKKQPERRRVKQQNEINRMKENIRNSINNSAPVNKRHSMNIVLEEMKNSAKHDQGDIEFLYTETLSDLKKQLSAIQLGIIGNLIVEKLKLEKERDDKLILNEYKKKLSNLGKQNIIDWNKKSFDSSEIMKIRDIFESIKEQRKKSKEKNIPFNITSFRDSLIISTIYGKKEEKDKASILREILESIVKHIGSGDIENIYKYLISILTEDSINTEKRPINQSLYRSPKGEKSIEERLQQIEEKIKQAKIEEAKIKAKIEKYGKQNNKRELETI